MAQRTFTRRRPRRWLFIGGPLVGVLGVLLTLGLAVTCRPASYRPRPIDHDRLRADKHALAALMDAIGDALNTGQPIRFQIDEAQLNRWIAARTEIWPDVLFDWGPVREPVISLRAGAVRAAAVVQHGPWSTVLCATTRVAVANDEISLSPEAVRVGILPVPRMAWTAALPQVRHSEHVRVDAASGTIVVHNDFVWPNGKRRYRVRELTLNDGAAEVVLEPRSVR